ncbi:hypothetical protein [Acinetobacter soli]|uniref:hypothetical protein n=1 Tax=Acinetobacter soli TaxID=487316 RepID=UPI00370AEA7C
MTLTKKFIRLMTLVMGLSLSATAMAKTEQIKLTRNLEMGEEAIIFTTAKGQVILNYYALADQVAKQLKPYKRGQCLQIQSRTGFYQQQDDGASIQSIRPCPKTVK